MNGPRRSSPTRKFQSHPCRRAVIHPLLIVQTIRILSDYLKVLPFEGGKPGCEQEELQRGVDSELIYAVRRLAYGLRSLRRNSDEEMQVRLSAEIMLRNHD